MNENSLYGNSDFSSNHTPIVLTDKEFQNISRLVYNDFGINLTEQKKTLVLTRLQKVLKTRGFKTFKAYYDYVVADKTGSALSDLVDKISTNHTYFYREKEHFSYLQSQVLPEITAMIKNKNECDLRIWCAGCSSGEEAYLLTITLLEFFGEKYSQWNAGLLATDISERALNIARKGVYENERMNLVPESIKQKYFNRLDANTWQVCEKVRREITFRRFNLMNHEFPFKKSFHVIFCRNVMIYFDNPTRDGLLKRFSRFTCPGGYLFIGHSESIGRDNDSYRYLMPAVYRKVMK